MPNYVITVEQLETVNRVYEIVVEDVNSEDDAIAEFDRRKYDMMWERVYEEKLETVDSEVIEVEEI
jgi:hypothetical protein